MLDNRYGNIKDDDLCILVRVDEYDREYLSLRELIAETTDEDILHAEYFVKENEQGDREIFSFTAWTEHHVLSLMDLVWGRYLLKVDRNFE